MMCVSALFLFGWIKTTLHTLGFSILGLEAISHPLVQFLLWALALLCTFIVELYCFALGAFFWVGEETYKALG